MDEPTEYEAEDAQEPPEEPAVNLEMERLLAIGRLRQATLESWLRGRKS